MADADSCSLVSLRGTYAVHAQGTIVGQLPALFPAPPFPFGEAGIVTFDGNGNHSGKTTVNIDGVVLTPTFNGTYTINSDCTGTITVNSSAGFTLHGAFVVTNHGRGTIETEIDRFAVASRTLEKIGD